MWRCERGKLPPDWTGIRCSSTPLPTGHGDGLQLWIQVPQDGYFEPLSSPWIASGCGATPRSHGRFGVSEGRQGPCGPFAGSINSRTGRSVAALGGMRRIRLKYRRGRARRPARERSSQSTRNPARRRSLPPTPASRSGGPPRIDAETVLARIARLEAAVYGAAGRGGTVAAAGPPCTEGGPVAHIGAPGVFLFEEMTTAPWT